MEAVEELNKMIDRLYYKYKSVEEMDYQTFLRDYIDWDYYVNVKLKNPKTNVIDYEFPNFYDIYALDDIADINNYVFIVEHSANRYMNLIKAIVRKFLKVEFSLGDYEKVVDHLSEYFYQSTKEMLNFESEDPDFNAIGEYLTFIENSSLDEIVKEFRENSEFADLLIASYCSDYIERKAEKETEEKNKEDQILSVQNVNEYIRSKILYLIDYFQQIGYSEESYIQMISWYLSNDITLGVIDSKLAEMLYHDLNKEYEYKVYMIYIIIYDFYLTATNEEFFPDVTKDDLIFADFIEHNPLEDIFTLFLNDREFRRAAISNFELLNILPNFRKLHVRNEIKAKFAPVYKIDTIFKSKNSK